MGRPYVCKNSWNELLALDKFKTLFWLRAGMVVHLKFITLENAIAVLLYSQDENILGWL
jgi:hypothetical protein